MNGSVSKPCTPVVHIKIASKWMFIPLKMVLMSIDPYPHWEQMFVYPLAIVPSDRQVQSCWSSPAFVVFFVPSLEKCWSQTPWCNAAERNAFLVHSNRLFTLPKPCSELTKAALLCLACCIDGSWCGHFPLVHWKTGLNHNQWPVQTTDLCKTSWVCRLGSWPFYNKKS